MSNPTNNTSENNPKGSNIPLIIAVLVVIVGIVLMLQPACKSGEELVGNKCLIKCDDGKTRVGEICTTTAQRIPCKGNEDRVGDKCLAQCDNGKTRVGEICTTTALMRIPCTGNEDRVGDECLAQCPAGISRNIFTRLCDVPRGRDGVECKSNEELYLFNCVEKCGDNKKRGLNGLCETQKGINGIKCIWNEELYGFTCRKKM